MVALVVAAVVLISINDDDEPGVAVPAKGDRLGDTITAFAAELRPDAPYRPPTAGEREDLVAALTPLFKSRSGIDQADALRQLGFTLTVETDSVTGRQYALAMNVRDTERAWGAYLIDLSTPVRAAVEVPHPNSDLGTERIGLALFRAVPGSVMLVAGTHRRVDKGDAAHRTDSAFHAVATDLSEKDIPQIQVHGFHDDSLPDTDVVVSPGAGKAGATVKRLADGIDGTGLAVCRSWERSCGRLEGNGNEQGKEAAKHECVFVHLETSRTVRDDEQRWNKIVSTIAGELAK
ncbi:hypothetical protein AOZ06_23175 [Kibdelosporangium phytohabitans]|uniref:Uncharacterized protein n=1 Tax=Kibdelosporangium phytohabitans TaxID=860235 RepID=A0A0N9HQL9_9PSEU|nr:hypothetical protein AOZ06_23175 [Kibdelosporangium phytohabitans]